MRTARTALAIAALVVMGGCGGQDDTVTTVPADSSPPSSAPPSDRAPVTELSISVSTGGTDADTTWRLTCEPPGGDHPDPEAACAAVEAAGAAAFAPPPKDQMCTEIYGGPQTASVIGVVGGEEVSATFGRTNGCEIARWDALADLLGSSGPA
ncbi:MAG TPA: SSI family serine proteinase inhibitor [Actinomycetales bacterium]|nr:SSI family serine proteinase inhibitor [Actinomycetales bacterium]